MEESATSLRLLLVFSVPKASQNQKSILQGMKLIGHDEINARHLRELIKASKLCHRRSVHLFNLVEQKGEEYARQLETGLDAKLKADYSSLSSIRPKSLQKL